MAQPRLGLGRFSGRGLSASCAPQELRTTGGLAILGVAWGPFLATDDIGFSLRPELGFGVMWAGEQSLASSYGASRINLAAMVGTGSRLGCPMDRNAGLWSTLTGRWNLCQPLTGTAPEYAPLHASLVHTAVGVGLRRTPRADQPTIPTR